MKVAAVCLFHVVACLSVVSALSGAKVLIVSFDGFRYDYLNKSSTPNLFRLREKSTYPEYMLNVFPTKTFPNHFSIATGLYAEEHGVLDSSMQEGGVNITYGPQMYNYKENVEPIWILNQKQGGVSGSMMWAAGELEFQQTKAKFMRPLDKGATWEEKITLAIGWFKDKNDPVNLVMMYFNQPDANAHKFGSNSKEVQSQIDKVDKMSKYLDDKLKESNLDLNVFLLSDHGMADVPFENIIDLTVKGNKRLASVKDMYRFIGNSPTLQVVPTSGKEKEVFEAFRAIAQEKGHFTVYRKSEIPDRWRVRNNKRIAAILLVADVGYCFSDILEWTSPLPVPGSVLGMHGYDNKAKEMHPFFLGWGPQIKRNHQMQPFNNVDLFSLWCKILGLKESENSGNFDNVKDMLVDYSISSNSAGSFYFTIITQIVMYFIRFISNF